LSDGDEQGNEVDEYEILLRRLMEGNTGQQRR